MTTPRTARQRRDDTLATLRSGRDVWVASADADGETHLVPLSYLWDGACLTMATLRDSRTARNLARAGYARVALPSTDDVVILAGKVETIPTDHDDALASAHAVATGFDARLEPEPYVYLRVRPETIQSWRDVAELQGRTIMRDGRWRDG